MPGEIQTQLAYVNGLPSGGKIPPATSQQDLSSGGITWRGVVESPVVIHKQSGLDRNTCALARTVMSEIGDSFDAWRLIPVAEVTRNMAKRKGIEPYQLLVGQTSKAYNFTQWQYGAGEGRYASTLLDPSQKTLAIAKMVVSGSQVIPENAVNWDQPSLQDKLFKAGKVTKDAVALAQSWGADGLKWIGPLPGVNPYDDAVFAWTGKRESNDDLVAVIKAARAGKDVTTPASSVPQIATTAATGIPWWLLVAGGAVGIHFL
jgi:hypothetical protein